MRKMSLNREQKTMSATAYVDQASTMADRLVNREARGPGDTDNAMRRCAQKFGVPYAFLWALRYRKPKRVFADLYFALQEAVERQRQQQERLFEHERAITEAKTWIDQTLIGAADALAGQKEGVGK